MLSILGVGLYPNILLYRLNIPFLKSGWLTLSFSVSEGIVLT